MATHYLVRFNDTLIASDAANTAGAVVERDASGNIVVSGASATSVSNSGADIKTGVQTLTGAGTVGANVSRVKLDATSAAFNATLQPAASSNGQTIRFIKIDSSANVPTIKGNAAENINGANTYASLTAQYNKVTLWCDGTQWWVVG